MSFLKKKNGGGFATIVVSLILVLVFSLITLGFAQISRREQQNSLNNQLSIQANYSAETAVNNSIKKLQAGTLSDNNDCNNNDNGLNTSYDNNVKITCVLVNKTPLDYSSIVNTTEGKVFQIQTFSLVDGLEFTWNSTNPKRTGVVSSFANPVNNQDYNAPSIVQLSATPLPDSNFNRNTLIANSFTVFLYPYASSNPATVDTITAGPGFTGGQYATKCTSGKCKIKFNITDAGKKSKRYLFHIIAPYGSPGDGISVKITAKSGSSTQQLLDTQAVIDSTARAQDVVRRIRVRVPLTNNLVNNKSIKHPDYVLQSDGLCKRMVVTTTTLPGSPSITETKASFSDPDNSTADSPSSCYLLDDKLD